MECSAPDWMACSDRRTIEGQRVPGTKGVNVEVDMFGKAQGVDAGLVIVTEIATAPLF